MAAAPPLPVEQVCELLVTSFGVRAECFTEAEDPRNKDRLFRINNYSDQNHKDGNLKSLKSSGEQAARSTGEEQNNFSFHHLIKRQ